MITVENTGSMPELSIKTECNGGDPSTEFPLRGNSAQDDTVGLLRPRCGVTLSEQRELNAMIRDEKDWNDRFAEVAEN